MCRATLYIFSGLPGSGKTALSRLLARRVGAAHLRIDTIEQALRDLCSVDVRAEGYRLAYRIASDILDAGVSVVADSCNPIELTRREWERVALDSGARYVNIEVVCTDRQEHRDRVEGRTSTILGMKLPTWHEVEDREYHEWTVERIVVDTSRRTAGECIEELLPRLSGDVLLTHRLATPDDLAVLRILMDAAISELQKPFLDEAQIASSRTIMGLDSQLIDDGTYFIVEADGELAGSGGWSRRATLYGSDESPGRNAALLNPAKDAARVRAMYTHPRHTRKGVGRLILFLCEEAARSEGFRRVELVATMAGEPLYRAAGYQPSERFTDNRGGVAVPLLRMSKQL